MSSPQPHVVILAIDHSEYADYAFDWYVKYLHKPENSVCCVHIPEFDVDKAHKEIAKTGSLKGGTEKAYSKIEGLEEKFHQKLKAAKVQGRVLSVPSKYPASAIIDTSKEEGAFVIVMGTRGLSKIKKALLGSVSDHVIQNAHIPVIVVRKSGEH